MNIDRIWILCRPSVSVICVFNVKRRLKKTICTTEIKCPTCVNDVATQFSKNIWKANSNAFQNYCEDIIFVKDIKNIWCQISHNPAAEWKCYSYVDVKLVTNLMSSWAHKYLIYYIILSVGTHSIYDDLSWEARLNCTIYPCFIVALSIDKLYNVTRFFTNNDRFVSNKGGNLEQLTFLQQTVRS